MSHPHFSLSALNPTAEYPINRALMKFPKLARSAGSLFGVHMEMLIAFFQDMNWNVDYSFRTLPRLRSERTQAETTLKGKFSSDMGLSMADYEFDLPWQTERDHFLLLSNGLCASIGVALDDDTMKRKAPKLYEWLVPKALAWKACGGMHGVLVAH